ncbi:acidic mammalian chitinase-like [Argopecten irradians]|uniref:acidic mammalian chitinase-like n=1 Tax=Argopecten irradians TaxID=31199 RepID=UPI003714AC7C
MVSKPRRQIEFVESTVQLLREYGFDGIDLDWEYGAITYSGVDKTKYSGLCRRLVNTFENECVKSRKTRLLLTTTVGTIKENVDAVYDIPEMIKHVDFFNLATDNLYRQVQDLGNQTSHHSPLVSRPNDTARESEFNMQWAARYWVQQGVPKSKINIGVSLEALSYILNNPANYEIGSVFNRIGDAGLYTGTPGVLSYYEVCLLLEQGGQSYRDYFIPYLVDGDLWVAYDDEQSLKDKVEWLVHEGYGGTVAYEIASDDFDFICNSSYRRFPLLNQIKDSLQAAEQKPSKYRQVCTFTVWAGDRPDGFTPWDIDPEVCTHITVSYATVRNDRLAPLYAQDLKLYRQINRLKNIYPNLKTILSVGGWESGSAAFSNMVSNRLSMFTFMLRHAFDSECLRSGKDRYLLTASVSPEKDVIDASYDTASMAR